MDEKFTAVTAKATDYGEYDKLLKLLTPAGVKTAVIKGVKKPKAKLKSSAMPFAFCEFTAAKRGNTAVITGASQIEDLFGITHSSESLTAGAVILETALYAFGEETQEYFVYMLRRLKDIIYGALNPYIQTIRFLQYIIHESGYGYEYKKTERCVTPLDLLSRIYYFDDYEQAAFDVSADLVIRTLFKLIENFERKFECEINSKSCI